MPGISKRERLHRRIREAILDELRAAVDREMAKGGLAPGLQYGEIGAAAAAAAERVLRVIDVHNGVPLQREAGPPGDGAGDATE